MGFISFIIFGLIAGALAKLIMPGNQNMGWLMTILLGMVGSFIGGFIGSLLGMGNLGTFSFKNLMLAIIGGLIALFVYAKVTNK